MRKKRLLVVGYKGFLGRNLYEYFMQCGEYHVKGLCSKDKIDDFVDEDYAYVIFAAGNSKTYLAEQDPISCIRRDYIDLVNILDKIKSKKFIIFSSCTVYSSNMKNQNENTLIDINELSLYGTHKLIMEKYLKELSKSWLILRPTSFFGRYLSKNLLFDLRHNRKQIYYNTNSKFDYLPIDDFCRIVDMVKDIENQVFNVGSGVIFPLEELLTMKGSINEYDYVSDHLVDNSSFSVDKIMKQTGLHFTKSKLRKQIYNYVRG